jgi:WD40 repeat protein/serine/threonine protein kinase
MTTGVPNEESLPLSVQLRIDAVCGRFEEAWKAVVVGGARPAIEAYLAGVAEPEHPALLRELLLLEMDYRKRLGEQPTREEYRSRFPEHRELLETLLDEKHGAPAPLPPEAPDPPAANCLPGQETGAEAERTGADVPAPRSAEDQTVSVEGSKLPTIPGYEIVAELGRGGMGVVYLAKNKLMSRHEVLKVVNKELLDHAGAAARFLREICSAAQLNHPNIVTAYAALPFGDLLVFAMEYVEGEDLARVVRARGPLPVVNACHYVQQAAMGLQHAFDKGMVHRDIKPANLILARDGKKHIIKILDFGLARAAREKEGASRKLTAVDRKLTQLGTVLGTPEYIAPEQILDAAGADIRADVYSLGCTLYFLLTGKPPFQEKSLDDLLQAHRSAEPTPLDKVQKEVPAELAAVVARMMAKDPTQRYQKPVDVAQALAPFVPPRLKPLPAGPPLPEGARPTPPDASPADDRTEVNTEGRWGAELPPLVIPRTRIEGSGTIARALDRAAGEADRPPGTLDEIERWDGQRPGVGAGAEDRPRGAPEWKLWAGLLLAGLAPMLLICAIALWASGVFRVNSPEGILVVEVNEPRPDVYVDGARVTANWRDDGKTAEIRLKPGTRKVEVKKDGFTGFGSEVELRADKRCVVTASLVRQTRPGEDEKPPPPPPPIVTQPQPMPVEAGTAEYDFTGGDRFVHFGPAGAQTALWCNIFEVAKQPVARVYDLAVGQPRTPPLDYHPWVHATFSADGRRVATISDDRAARVWDAATGQPLSPALQHDGLVVEATFSPDGKRLVTSSEDKTARIWDAETGKGLIPPLKHDGVVRHATFSPDGKQVVTTSEDKTVRLWEAATGRPLTPPLKHDGVVWHATFSPDGKRVATTSEDRTALVWEVATGKVVNPPFFQPLQHAAGVLHATFSPDGTRLATTCRDGTARVWEAATGRPVTPPLKHDGVVRIATFSPDGKQVVTTGEDRAARVWDTATGQPLSTPLKYDGGVRLATFSPDGKRVVSAGTDGTARVWDAVTGQLVASPLKHDAVVRQATFSPDSKKVITASADESARVWNAATGKALPLLLQHAKAVSQATFSPDGKWVATASDDSTARVWDAATGEPVSPPLQHGGAVWNVTFSPDGKRLVTASEDKMARVWDVAKGMVVSPPLVHRGGVRQATFSPDGKRVVTASEDGTARVWNAETGDPITPSLQHGSAVRHATFSPDGKRVVTANDRGVRLAMLTRDGEWLLTGSEDAMSLWDAKTGTLLMQVTLSWDPETGKVLKQVTLPPD